VDCVDMKILFIWKSMAICISFVGKWKDRGSNFGHCIYTMSYQLS
jgi:hypothetical protein